MADIDGNPLDKEGVPFAVGLLALVVAGLAVVIYGMQGTWPAGYGGLAALLFLLLGIVLLVISWQAD